MRLLLVGDVVYDTVVRPLEPTTNGSDTRARIRRGGGGSAANQAVWLGALGAAVTFVGRVGAPDLEALRAELAGWGVTPRLVGDPALPTGEIVILVDEAGERTMFVDRAANLALHSEDVSDADLDAADLLHLSGYSFFSPGTRAAVLDLIARATRRGLPFSVDPGSVAFLREVGAAAFLDWTSGARFAFPNRDEAELLTGTTNVRDMAHALTAAYETVIITLGADGAAAAGRDGTFVEVPAPGVAAKDTTRAGDALCAGFLAAWASGGRLPDALASSVRTAGRALSQVGARPPDHSRPH